MCLGYLAVPSAPLTMTLRGLPPGVVWALLQTSPGGLAEGGAGGGGGAVFVCSVNYPRASLLSILTERYLWSCRPLTSHIFFCALFCLPPVHT